MANCYLNWNEKDGRKKNEKQEEGKSGASSRGNTSSSSIY